MQSTNATSTDERSDTTLGAVINGMIAGALATWALSGVTNYLYEHESKPAREREDSARGGSTAYETAAAKVAHAAGVQIDKQGAEKAGEAIHWGLGIGAGALYGLTRDRIHLSPLARGLAFGATFWLVMDETATPVLGLVPGPGAFPWQTHARGLAGHLAFGATAEAALALLTDRGTDAHDVARR